VNASWGFTFSNISNVGEDKMLRYKTCMGRNKNADKTLFGKPHGKIL
jgi:hypothetical protein